MPDKQNAPRDSVQEANDRAPDGVDGYIRGLLDRAEAIVGAMERELGSMPLRERRSGQRTQTTYRLVRIESDGDQGLAWCRNISDTGVKLELSMPVEIGHAVTVAFSPSNIVSGRVIWTSGNSCGTAFDSRVDSAALLKASAAEMRRHRPRPMRLETNLPAWVSFDGFCQEVVVLDLSQGGAKLRHDGTFHEGLCVNVVLPSGAERDGVVRWSKDGVAGVYFLEPFTIEELGSVRAL